MVPHLHLDSWVPDLFWYKVSGGCFSAVGFNADRRSSGFKILRQLNIPTPITFFLFFFIFTVSFQNLKCKKLTPGTKLLVYIFICKDSFLFVFFFLHALLSYKVVGRLSVLRGSPQLFEYCFGTAVVINISNLINIVFVLFFMQELACI